MAQELKAKSLDAICISPIAWKTLNSGAPGAFRVLGETSQVPGFAISLDSSLPTLEKKKLTAILTGIGKKPEGKAALAAIIGSASGAAETLTASNRE